MKHKGIKSLFVAALSLLGAQGASATTVTITLNNLARSMKLAPVGTTEEVELGENKGSASSPKYVIDLDEGDYLLEGFNTDGESCGTIVLPVTGDKMNYQMLTVTFYANNKNEEGEFWKLGEDYDIDRDAFLGGAPEGVVRVITPGVRTQTVSGQTIKVGSAMLVKGCSYRAVLVPDAERHPGYTQSIIYNTVTFNATHQTELRPAVTYTITVPSEATLFVGRKDGPHYVPFSEMLPVEKSELGDKTQYTFNLAGGKQVYNYRVSMDGCMTHAGKFGFSEDYPKYSFEITREEMLAHGTPDYTNHIESDYSGGNLADIYLNINERGHLSLEPGAEYQLMPQRVWQLIDDQSNNYFVDPDFRYTVVDTEFRPSDAVVTVDSSNRLHAVGKGTAIVRVSYDAMYCYEYNRVDAFGGFGLDQPYWFGAKWSRLWAENTGLFVVTVGEDVSTVVPNFNINERIADKRGNIKLDAELDILYYHESEPGYRYTFKPEGAVSVTLANPAVNSEANTVTYTGFSADNVTVNDDGSYTLLLTYGRNIVRMTDAAGNSAYQVVSAKPFGYTISNTDDPGATTLTPGKKVNVQFHGLYHPASKLSGIYNQSAYINFNGSPNGNSLILTPNQYSFAGSESAQLYQFTLPEDTENSYTLSDGSLYVRGYGSVGGRHRGITKTAGVNPNFTAVVTTEYWGTIPDVEVPLTLPQATLAVKGVPEGSEIVVSRGGYVVPADDDDPMAFAMTAGRYHYTVNAAGYAPISGLVSIAEGANELNVNLVKPEVEGNGWDGTTVVVPSKVSDENVEEYNGHKDYYIINNGAELAFVAARVNGGNPVVNFVLGGDIDLENRKFTPISKASSTNFNGEFDGMGHEIAGLNATGLTGNAGLFGVIKGGSTAYIHDFTIRGEVASAGNYAGAVVASSAASAVRIENIRSYVNVYGSNYTGGIVGNLSSSFTDPEAENWVLRNLVSYGTVNGNNYVGGIAGSVKSSTANLISRVGSEGRLTARDASAVLGGLAGQSTLVNYLDCYVAGDMDTTLVTNTGKVGNLVGEMAGVTYDEPYDVMTFTNVFTMSDTIVTGLTRAAATFVNAYVLSDVEQETAGVTALGADEFTSGRLALRLGDAFGQTIGTENHPVLGGEAIYNVEYTSSCNPEAEHILSNSLLPEAPEFTEPDGEVHRGMWLTEEGGEPVASIFEDSRLFVDYPVPALSLDSVKVRMDEIAVIDLAEYVEAPFGLPVSYSIAAPLADDANVEAAIDGSELTVKPKSVGDTRFAIVYSANGFEREKEIGVKVSAAPQVGLEECGLTGGSVTVEGRMLIVSGFEGTDFAVYAADGREVIRFTAGAGSHSCRLESGIYIVAASNGLRSKIAIR